MAVNSYESPKLLSEYLFFHYGTGETSLPVEALDFASRVVSELRDPSASLQRALDVGCAVGRSSFELARHCPEVIGIDFSHSFVEAARQMKASGKATVNITIEGDRSEERQVSIPTGMDASRVSFETGDATDLRADLGDFDIVLAANLICRLPDPRKFLRRLPQLVRPGGQLLLATPFTWLEEYTPRSLWLGANPSDDRPSFDVLREILEPDFALEFTRDLPFLIREHSRKYQYGISLGSRWRRR